jgi:hypothetical protein
MRRRAGLAGAGLTVLSCLPALCLTARTAASPPLTHFLLRSGDQPGFSVSGTPKTVASAVEFMQGGASPSQISSAVSILNHAGFVQAAEEHTSGAGGQGFSFVVEFKSAAGARAGAALLLYLAGQTKGTKPKVFTITGFANARGVTQVATAGAGASANVYWFDGRCMLGLGLLTKAGAHKTGAQLARPVVLGIKKQLIRFGSSCP